MACHDGDIAARAQRPGEHVVAHEAALEEHPAHLHAVVAREVLLIAYVVSLHLQHIVSVLGKRGGIQLEDAVVLHHRDGHADALLLTLVAHDDVFAREGLWLHGLVEGHRQLVDDIRCDVVVIGHRFDAHDAEAHFRLWFELHDEAERLRRVGKGHDVQFVLGQGVEAVLHGILRCPEVLRVEVLAGVLVPERDDACECSARIGNGGVEPFALRHGNADAVVHGVDAFHAGHARQRLHLVVSAVSEVDAVWFAVTVLEVVAQPCAVRLGAELGVHAVHEFVYRHLVE